jgi:hypothetical protein
MPACSGALGARCGAGPRLKCSDAFSAVHLWAEGYREIAKIAKANRIETMKGPAESGQICSVGRRKIAKKIAKNKRCYANTLRPRSRMLLKVMKGG